MIGTAPRAITACITSNTVPAEEAALVAAVWLTAGATINGVLTDGDVFISNDGMFLWVVGIFKRHFTVTSSGTFCCSVCALYSLTPLSSPVCSQKDLEFCWRDKIVPKRSCRFTLNIDFSSCKKGRLPRLNTQLFRFRRALNYSYQSTECSGNILFVFLIRFTVPTLDWIGVELLVISIIVRIEARDPAIASQKNC